MYGLRGRNESVERGCLEKATRGMKVEGGRREGSGTSSPGKRTEDLAHRGRDRENERFVSNSCTKERESGPLCRRGKHREKRALNRLRSVRIKALLDRQRFSFSLSLPPLIGVERTGGTFVRAETGLCFKF